jgi:hypothetical protein
VSGEAYGMSQDEIDESVGQFLIDLEGDLEQLSKDHKIK